MKAHTHYAQVFRLATGIDERDIISDLPTEGQPYT